MPRQRALKWLGLGVAAVAIACTSDLLAAPPTQEPSHLLLCSFVPIELFVRQVVETDPRFAVARLMPAAGGCPHHYAGVSGGDLEKVRRAEVLIVNGAGLEAALLPAVQRINPRLAVVEAAAGLTPLVSAGVKNPHFFSSPALAGAMVRAVAAGLGRAFPAAAPAFFANAERAARRYQALAEEMRAALAPFAGRRLVAGSEVFDYLARDLGLALVAKIEEHSRQTASGKQLLALRRLLAEQKVAALIQDPSETSRLAKTLAEESKLPLLFLDPFTGGPEGATFDDYARAMRNNVAALKAAFGASR